MNSYKIEDKTIFSSVDISVDRGERIAIVGPSGHGKSTLLKILAGLLPLQSGELIIDDESFYKKTDFEQQKARSKMGMLFQKNALFDSLSAIDNVRFPLKEVTKKSEQEIETLSVNALESVGILHAKDLFPDEISGGMQKRLGIARAQVLEPPILFYDDPTAGLDPITSRKIIDLIIQLQEKISSTILVVTNEMARAYQVAHRIWYVGEGRIVDLGAPENAKKIKDSVILDFLNGIPQSPGTGAEGI